MVIKFKSSIGVAQSNMTPPPLRGNTLIHILIFIIVKIQLYQFYIVILSKTQFYIKEIKSYGSNLLARLIFQKYELSRA